MEDGENRFYAYCWLLRHLCEDIDRLGTKLSRTCPGSVEPEKGKKRDVVKAAMARARIAEVASKVIKDMTALRKAELASRKRTFFVGQVGSRDGVFSPAGVAEKRMEPLQLDAQIREIKSKVEQARAEAQAEAAIA
jgi:hypothetical protein